MSNRGKTLKSLALPAGFRTAGIAAGIKDGTTKDMALIVSDVPAAVAGTFTTNQVKAAPVKLCKERLAGGLARAIVVNSGVANACTGEQGLADARRMTTEVARHLGCDEKLVFVCSTGSIGKMLPMPVIEKGIAKLAGSLSADHGALAAEAIMTTDTRPKHATAELDIDGKAVRLTGFAKGAGMIEPNMATMLAFILTDAAVDQPALQECLSAAVTNSFNRITVDGDMSTNDTVLCLANGQAKNATLNAGHAAWGAFCEAVEDIAVDLALQIVEDGEGAKKRVTIHVQGAASQEDAEAAARAIANSLLVKTSWVKKAANWGRVMDALGYSEAKVREELVDLDYNDLPAVRGGCAAGTEVARLQEIVAQKSFLIRIDLHLGEAEAVVYTCDCTEEYVRINF